MDSILAYIGPGAGLSLVGSFLVLLSASLMLVFSLLTLPIRLALYWYRRRAAGLRGPIPQVVVVGLDGLDPGRVRRLIEEGRLPHLKKLADDGTFCDLQTTLPPISPVAWSSFQTGVNPGKHNIFDFLNRDLRTYLPELSSVRVTAPPQSPWWRRWLDRSQVKLLRKSQPFWKLLGDCGIFSTVLRVPISFPPERFFGLSLSAMCTPDLRGTQGEFTLFTTDAAEAEALTGGRRELLERKGQQLEAWLVGPPHPVTGVSLRTRLRVRLHDDRSKRGARFQRANRDAEAGTLETCPTSGDEVTLHIGRETLRLRLHESTGWVSVSFRVGWFNRVRGLCQFRLEALQPEVRLYVSPIQLDPERPAMTISYPSYYAIYLAKLHGAFATAGLAEDTWGLNSGAMSEAAFLDQAYRIHDERERMLLDAMQRMRRGLTVCVFDGPDRIQHMFSRHDQADHPANAGRDCQKHAGVIDDMYARMDGLVGRVRAALPRDAVLIVMSDHGFCAFRRGVNLNAWLRTEGFLSVVPETAAGEYFKEVDWSKTRAYSFGLSGIYLNLRGREAQGIVPSEDAAALVREIADKLSSWTDPQDGVRIVSRAYVASENYRGPYAGNGPDLIVGYERGYRASWEGAVGRATGPALHDNTRLWSGDHCVDPELVPGTFFVNHKLDGDGLSMLDVAPTILGVFGLPTPSYMDGKARMLTTARVPAEVGK